MPAEDPTGGLGRLAEHSRRLLALVTWDWEPLQPKFDEARLVIPPGKALRRYQKNRSREDRRIEGTGTSKPPLTEAEQIKSGERALLNDSLASLRYRFVEMEDRPDGRWVRRKSQVPPTERCPHCGRHGVEDESVNAPGAPTDGVVPDDQGEFDFPSRFPNGGVVVPFDRARDQEAEQLRQAVESAVEPTPESEAQVVDPGSGATAAVDGPTQADVIMAVSQLVSMVEEQGKKLDKVAALAQSAKDQARITAMKVNGRTTQRRRTRGGQ